jgi:hypothetical protein
MAYSLNLVVDEIEDAFSLAEQGQTSVFHVLPKFVTDLDLLAQVQEAIGNLKIDADKKLRIEVLHRFLIEAFVEYQLPDTHVRDFVRFEPARDIRQVESRKVELKSSSLLDTWKRNLDTRLQRMAQLKLTGTAYVTMRSPIPLEHRLEQANQLLKATQDGFNEVLPFALKQVEPDLKPRNSEWHDLERACLLPSEFSVFSKEDVYASVSRQIAEMFGSPDANKRIKVSISPMGNTESCASLKVLEIPSKVTLDLKADRSFEVWEHFFSKWGRALYWANVSEHLPTVHRRLGSDLFPLAFSSVVPLALHDERFLARYGNTTPKQARDVARLAAFSQLTKLRISAIHLKHRIASLLSGGYSDSMLEEYTEEMSKIMGVGHSIQRMPMELSSWQVGVSHFEAFSLAANLTKHLTERFHEDYFRNPAAGNYLKQLATRGQQIPPAEWCGTSDKTEFTCHTLTQRLLSVLNK